MVPKFKLYSSEIRTILHTQFTTIATIDILIARTDERDLTVCTESISQSKTNTCLTRRNSLISATVRSDQTSATLDVVRTRSAKSTLVTYMEICRCSSVIRTRPTSIGFYVDVGTCKCSRGLASVEVAATAAKAVLIIVVYLFVYLRSVYPQMIADSTCLRWGIL